MFAFWHHSQHQKWQFLNSNMYMWHRAFALRVMLKNNDWDQSSSWWGCSLAETGYVFERATWILWNGLPQNSLLTEKKSWCKPFAEKELLFPQELPSLKEDLTCKSVFPWQLSKSLNMQHSSLEITGVLRSKLRINSRVHMQEVLDQAANLQWPATSSSSRSIRAPGPSILVSQDLLCFSWCTFLCMRDVHGIK